MTSPSLSNPRERKILIALAFVISLFSTLFMWRFWSFGSDIFGINWMIYGFSIVGFFLYVRRGKLTKKTLSWLIPIVFIIAGMGIYTTQFSKPISLSILPIAFLIFTTHEIHKKLRPSLWGRGIISETIAAILNYTTAIFESPRLISFKREKPLLPSLSAERKNLIIQIGLGVLLLFIISLFVIIPLLSSVDSTFGEMFSGILEAMRNILRNINVFIALLFENFSIYRVIATLLGMMMLLGYAIYWRYDLEPDTNEKKDSNSAQKYSITLGIVLGGVLLLYLVFIGIQIKTLFVGSLPAEFSATEKLVKTGFWQLFVLTIINIFFYLGIYNKSTQNIQRILSVFTFVSLLLIVSAAHRTYLYVVNYGLSYEKFYALYTVVFCIGIFAWFLSLFARGNKKTSIIKALAFASLWMYSLTTIVPLEKIIFSTNLKLTQNPESRIDINEMHMLGYDVLAFTEKHQKELLTLAREDHLTSSYKDQAFVASSEWNKWYEYVSNWQNKKKWYEKTITELVHTPNNPFSAPTLPKIPLKNLN